MSNVLNSAYSKSPICETATINQPWAFVSGIVNYLNKPELIVQYVKNKLLTLLK